MASKKAESYDACPYCLTEILVEASAVMKEEQKLEAEEIKVEAPSAHQDEEKSAQEHSKGQGCLHNFGYLSKRSNKEKIPEECMICESIVQCMLKNVTS